MGSIGQGLYLEIVLGFYDGASAPWKYHENGERKRQREDQQFEELREQWIIKRASDATESPVSTTTDEARGTDLKQDKDKSPPPEESPDEDVVVADSEEQKEEGT